MTQGEPHDTVTVKLSRRAYDALVGLKGEEEDLEAFVLRLTTAARTSAFFGQGIQRGEKEDS